MDQGALLETIVPVDKPAGSPEFALNVTIVYEDAATHDWAGEVCERVSHLLGPECVRRTWWKLSDLTEPAVLAGAVSTALRADVVIVAIHAAEALSLPFYVWIQSWLPHRPSRLAALVALVALPSQPSLGSDRAQDYLRAVAREGQLDFLLEERKLPVGQSELSCPQVQPRHSQPTDTTKAARGRFLKRAAVRSNGALLKSSAAA